MTLPVSDLWTMNDFPGRSSSEVLTGCSTGLRYGSLDGLGVGFRGWPECRASSLGRALGLCGRLAGRCRGGQQGGVVRLYGLDLAAQFLFLLPRPSPPFPLPPRGPLGRLRGPRRARLRHALGATVGFLGCALALLDMLPQAPPKASSPQKDGKTRVAECDNPTLAYFLLRRKLLGNLPESVAFSSLACLGVESNP